MRHSEAIQMLLTGLAVCGAFGVMGQERPAPVPAVFAVLPRLDPGLPRLYPPAVLYAIFDEDPAEGFRQALSYRKGVLREQLDDDYRASSKEKIKAGAIRQAWQQTFRKVTGDRVHVLTPASSSAEEAPRPPGENPRIGVVAAARARALGSFGGSAGEIRPPHKKWLATKVVNVDGIPTSWVFPIEPGQEPEALILSGDNAFDSGMVYDEVMAD